MTIPYGVVRYRRPSADPDAGLVAVVSDREGAPVDRVPLTYEGDGWWAGRLPLLVDGQLLVITPEG